MSSADTLQHRYAQEREVQRIPLTLPSGKTIALTPGGQNVLVKKVLDEFCPLFTPGAKPLYGGDTGEKLACFDAAALSELGLTLNLHSRIPDVVIHDEAKGWLVLILLGVLEPRALGTPTSHGASSVDLDLTRPARARTPGYAGLSQRWV